MKQIRRSRHSPRPIHTCGGGYERTDNATDGRPRFRCTKCGETWTEGHSGGDSMRALQKKLLRVVK